MNTFLPQGQSVTMEHLILLTQIAAQMADAVNTAAQTELTISTVAQTEQTILPAACQRLHHLHQEQLLDHCATMVHQTLLTQIAARMAVAVSTVAQMVLTTNTVAQTEPTTLPAACLHHHHQLVRHLLPDHCATMVLQTLLTQIAAQMVVAVNTAAQMVLTTNIVAQTEPTTLPAACLLHHHQLVHHHLLDHCVTMALQTLPIQTVA
jgi:hypothetical protein